MIKIMKVLAQLFPRETFFLLRDEHEQWAVPTQILSFKNWMKLDPSGVFEYTSSLPSESQKTLFLAGWTHSNSEVKELTWYEQNKRDIDTTSALESLALANPRLAVDWIERELVDSNLRREIEYLILDELVRVEPELAIDVASLHPRVFDKRTSMYKVVDALTLYDLNNAIELLPKFDTEPNRAKIYARIAREVFLQGEANRAFELGKDLLTADGSANADSELFNKLIALEWYRFDNTGFVNGIEKLDVSERERSNLIRFALLEAHGPVPATESDLEKLMPLMNADDIKKIENASWFKSLSDFR